jgi:4-amino-4-deoxy-L-arabinose transferase-like glycosyltransferase
MSAAKSSKAPAATEPRLRMPKAIDWLILVAILILMLAMVHAGGSRRGLELMPWPDGLEYAASAVNLAKGRGAVLHFGGYTYPSRYTAGYPLILKFVRVGSVSRDPPFLVTTVLGMASVFFVFWLAGAMLGRTGRTIAPLLLATSPVFITYSSLVMSDVPTLCVTLLAVMVLMVAPSELAPRLPGSIQLSTWLGFGLLAGLSVIVRPTNAVILVGLALCFVMVPLEKRGTSLLSAAVAVAIGFAIPVAWQLHQNAINLGSPFASGYAWWVPEVYGEGGRTFSAAYLFGPTMPRNPYGNVLVYVTTLLGLDGFVGHRASPGYFLYPFAAAAFAIVGVFAALRVSGRNAMRRLMWFGIGYLGALTLLYCFYIFTDVAFLLPGAFILFIAAGMGAEASNRFVRDVIRNPKRSGFKVAAAASVIVLDVMLVVSIATEAAARLSVEPQPSAMVESLESLNSSLPNNATIVSNVSLQFLDLYLGEERSYVGLNSMDPGERFTDYHLHRLYEKRAMGWEGPVPPVVFDGGQMSAGEADAIASAIAAKTPVYVIVAAPESQQYADVLKSEMEQLGATFAIEPVSQNGAIAVYRLDKKG